MKPLKPGAYAFPPLTAVLSDPEQVKDFATEMRSPPFFLDVYEANEEFGLPINTFERVNAVPFLLRLLPWFAILPLISLTVIRLIRSQTTKRKQKEPKETREIVSDLSVLENLKKEYHRLLKDYKAMLTPEETRAFYYQMSGFIRAYIDAAYRTELSSKTPYEIKRVFRERNEIESRTEESICGFLESCDTVKYSLFCPAKNKIETDVKSFKKITLAISKEKIG
jgi:hypothetical protein